MINDNEIYVRYMGLQVFYISYILNCSLSQLLVVRSEHVRKRRRACSCGAGVGVSGKDHNCSSAGAGAVLSVSIPLLETLTVGRFLT